MEKLFDKLKKNSRIPFHMPGHKRNAPAFPYLSDFAGIDITEIQGFDNLHDPRGVLKESMECAARLRGAKAAFYLVNGATCGILAAVNTVLGYGDKVIMARNCHKSVYNAVELCGAVPVYVYPDFDAKHGICGSVSPQKVEAALEENPDAKLVIVTSPTYEGVISDIKSICEYAHKRNTAVLTDAAHGAHLGFGGFCDDAISLGADISVESLHKTLPSLTQTAICYLSGELVDPEALAEKLAVFETSSPSYILLSSADGCVKTLISDKDKLFDIWEKNIGRFLDGVKGLKNVEILGNCGYFDFDKSKIVIFAGGLSGAELAEILRNFNIEPEAVLGNYVICMTGMGDGEESFDALKKALFEADKAAKPEKKTALLPAFSEETELSLCEALKSEKIYCSIENSVGRMSAGYVWAYPPGVPILVPGEKISEGVAKLLVSYGENGISLCGNIREDGIPVVKNL